MAYLIIFHWGWLFGALLLGFGMGWIALVQRSQPLSKAMLQRIVAVVVFFVVVTVTRLIPGRAGYLFDLGLMMFALYLVGCTAGSWLRDHVISRHTSTR